MHSTQDNSSYPHNAVACGGLCGSNEKILAFPRVVVKSISTEAHMLLWMSLLESSWLFCYTSQIKNTRQRSTFSGCFLQSTWHFLLFYFLHFFLLFSIFNLILFFFSSLFYFGFVCLFLVFIDFSCFLSGFTLFLYTIFIYF